MGEKRAQSKMRRSNSNKKRGREKQNKNWQVRGRRPTTYCMMIKCFVFVFCFEKKRLGLKSVMRKDPMTP
jgi:hypothetical protein